MLRLRKCSVTANKENRLQTSHSEELRDLYASTDVTWVIKSRRIRWVGHTTRIEANTQRVLVRKPERRRLLE